MNNDMYTAHGQIVRLERKLQWLADMGGEQWDAQDGDKLERKLSDMKADYERKYIVMVN